MTLDDNKTITIDKEVFMNKKIFSLLFSLILLSPLPILAKKKAKTEENLPRGDGAVRLYNYHLNEFIDLKFRENGKPIPEALQLANRFLRSRGNLQEKDIDLSLLDLADHLQDHFGADTVEIISAYRDRELNDSLVQTGHTVSPKSLHTEGRALDIHIDEIREETLRDYLKGLNFGGLGYYPALDFVHVDNGPVRQWEEPAGERKLVGVLKPEAPVQLTSDKNDYLPQEPLLFTWGFQGNAKLKQVRELKLELFRQGKWIACDSQTETQDSPRWNAETLASKKLGLPAQTLLCKQGDSTPTFGKYRWTFKLTGSDEPLSSNEFYLKKM